MSGLKEIISLSSEIILSFASEPALIELQKFSPPQTSIISLTHFILEIIE